MREGDDNVLLAGENDSGNADHRCEERDELKAVEIEERVREL